MFNGVTPPGSVVVVPSLAGWVRAAPPVASGFASAVGWEEGSGFI